MISTPAPFGVWPPQGPALSQPPLESPDPTGPLIPVISTLWTTFTVEGLPVAYSPGSQQLPPPHPPSTHTQTSSQMWSGWHRDAPWSQTQLKLFIDFFSQLTRAVAPPSKDACLAWAFPGLVAQQVTRMPYSSPLQAQDTGHRVLCIWPLEKQDVPPSEGCLSKVSAFTTLSGHG